MQVIKECQYFLCALSIVFVLIVKYFVIFI